MYVLLDKNTLPNTVNADKLSFVYFVKSQHQFMISVDNVNKRTI